MTRSSVAESPQKCSTWILFFHGTPIPRKALAILAMTCKLLSSIDVIRCNVCIYGLISIPYTTLQKHLALLNTIHPIPGYKTWNRNVVLAVLISWRTCKLAGASFRLCLSSHTVMSMCSRVLVFGWKVIPPPIMTYVRLQGLQSARIEVLGLFLLLYIF